MFVFQDGKYNESIEAAVRGKLGNSWKIQNVRPTHSDAMHANAIFEGKDVSVFVKLGKNPYSFDQFKKEADGLNYIRENSCVSTPEVFGVVKVGEDVLLILEAVRQAPIKDKKDWEALGRGLAALHKTTFDKCGFFEDNFLGTWPQNNDFRDNCMVNGVNIPVVSYVI